MLRFVRRRPLVSLASVLATAAAVSLASETDAAAGIVVITQGVRRSSRAVYAIAVNSIDYKYSLRNHDSKTEEYYRVLSEVHLRAAKRILRLCELNGGFYTKAGQFVASLQHFPKEYIDNLKVLQDQAQFWPFKAIEKIFREEFGRSPLEIFQQFDKNPIAAASLAQVHHAVLSDGEEVAVKVQYPGLQRQFEIDISTMAILSKLVALIFPDYQFEWLVPEFEKNLLRELDFLKEASNAQRTAANFAHRKEVKIPSIHWELTSSRILTMHFMHGCKIDDVDSILKAGIDTKQVAQLLLQVFAEMIFCYGFVHGDPHPGNILVHHNPKSKHNFELVLLDHGLYRELNEEFRKDFCRLWKAMILSDTDEMQKAGEMLGAGSYHRFLPVILTGRSSGRSAFGKGLSAEEKQRLREEVRRFSMGDIAQFMEGLSRDFLIVLRTDGLLRTIVNKLEAPPKFRLVTYGQYAVFADSMYGHSGTGIVRYSRSLVQYAYLRLRIEMLVVFYSVEAICTAAVKHLYGMSKLLLLWINQNPKAI